MPQVASDPKVHAPNLHMPRVARPYRRLPSLRRRSTKARLPRATTSRRPQKAGTVKAAEPNDDTKPANTDEAVTADEGPADGSTARVDGKKVAKPEATGDVGDVGDSIHPG